MIGISQYNVHIPWRRLSRASIAQGHQWFAPALKAHAKGERAIANWDEDAITMGVEAARGCMTDADVPSSIYLGSTTLPFADRQNAAVIKEALILDDFTATTDLTGSWRAGMAALHQGLRRAQTQNAMSVAAEKSKPSPMSEAEMTSGDAAAAFLLSDTDVIAEFIGAQALSVDFVGHYRADGQHAAYHWESRWVRDEGYNKIVPKAVNKLLSDHGLTGKDISHFAFGAPMRGLAKRMAKTLGIEEGAIVADCDNAVGFCAAAHPLLLLAAALDKAAPGDTFLVVGFGQGCDAMLFRATEQISEYCPAQTVQEALAQKQESENYLQYLILNGLLETDQGMRAEQDQKTPLTALYRDRKSIYGLVGGRCTKTGVIQYPKSDISVAKNDWTVGSQEDYPLADLPATIVTFTEDYLAFTPSPPYAYGMIEFEGGGRMVAEFADFGTDDLAVGTPVRMVFRIKNEDKNRHFKKYFWKAVPVR